MSLDRLRVSGTQTVLEAPNTYENSALTSVTRTVALGGGFSVTETGKQILRPYPNVGTAAISVTASAFAFTNAMIASTVIRATSDGQAAVLATMPVPATSGQLVTIINTGRHRITFDPASATSNVAGGQLGQAAFVSSYSSQTFLSDGTLWYSNGRVG